MWPGDSVGNGASGVDEDGVARGDRVVIGQLPHDHHAVDRCGLHAFIPGGGAAGTGALRSVCRDVCERGRNLRSSIGRSAHGDLFRGLLADEEPNRQGRVVRLSDHRPVLRPGNVPLISRCKKP